MIYISFTEIAITPFSNSFFKVLSQDLYGGRDCETHPSSTQPE
jgi:hypothetical protein